MGFRSAFGKLSDLPWRTRLRSYNASILGVGVVFVRFGSIRPFFVRTWDSFESGLAHSVARLLLNLVFKEHAEASEILVEGKKRTVLNGCSGE